MQELEERIRTIYTRPKQKESQRNYFYILNQSIFTRSRVYHHCLIGNIVIIIFSLYQLGHGNNVSHFSLSDPLKRSHRALSSRATSLTAGLSSGRTDLDRARV